MRINKSTLFYSFCTNNSIYFVEYLCNFFKFIFKKLKSNKRLTTFLMKKHFGVSTVFEGVLIIDKWLEMNYAQVNNSKT